MSEEQKGVTPKSAWISTSYERAPWMRTKCAERVAPPNEQATNNELSDAEVLQPRAEPVGISHAFPIAGAGDQPTGGIAPTSSII
jgi:hypothetical protein